MTSKPVVSLCLLTLDRYELLTRCVKISLDRANYPYELLWCDNGSRDIRVRDYVTTVLQPIYSRLNHENEGIPAMLNQLLLRAKGEYLCTLDDDLILPENWLLELVNCYHILENPGIGGVWCGLGSGTREIHRGKAIATTHEVLGVKLFDRKFLRKVGYFSEFSLYGLDDADLSLRSRNSGLQNYYLDGLQASHEGLEDPRFITPYRAFKYEHLAVAKYGFERQQKRYARTGCYYVPPPPLLRGDNESDEEWNEWKNFKYDVPEPIWAKQISILKEQYERFKRKIKRP